MKLDQFVGYTAFLAVAKHEGFSAAAIELEVTPSALSQAITSLEHRVGARLFHRTTRSVRLTEAGSEFLTRIGPALQELVAAGSDLAEHAARPFGTLRFTAPRIAFPLLEAIVPSFLVQYPDVKVDMSVDDAFVDIVTGGFDAGIRLGESVEKDMVATRIGPRQQAVIVASPAYLKQHGTPKIPEDLAAHNCIRQRLASGTIYRWEFEVDGKDLSVDVAGSLTVNDPALAVAAATAGVGLAFSFKGFVVRELENGTLVRVLTKYSPVFSEYFLYYPSRRQLPAKLQAFINHCRSIK